MTVIHGHFGTGIVGTGAYLRRRSGSWRGETGGEVEVDVWLHVLFLPLLPLGRWRGSATLADEVSPGWGELEIVVRARSRVPVARVVGRVATATASAVAICLPLALGVWEGPWASRLAALLLGSILSPGLLGALAMPLEMSVTAVEVGLPVLLLAYLDRSVPRVPLLVALSTRERMDETRSEG